MSVIFSRDSIRCDDSCLLSTIEYVFTDFCAVCASDVMIEFKVNSRRELHMQLLDRVNSITCARGVMNYILLVFRMIAREVLAPILAFHFNMRLHVMDLETNTIREYTQNILPLVLIRARANILYKHIAEIVDGIKTQTRALFATIIDANLYEDTDFIPSEHLIPIIWYIYVETTSKSSVHSLIQWICKEGRMPLFYGLSEIVDLVRARTFVGRFMGAPVLRAMQDELYMCMMLFC